MVGLLVGAVGFGDWDLRRLVLDKGEVLVVVAVDARGVGWCWVGGHGGLGVGCGGGCWRGGGLCCRCRHDGRVVGCMHCGSMDFCHCRNGSFSL